MTINESLRRRVRLLFLALMAVWAAIPVCVHFFGTIEPKVIGLPWPILLCGMGFAAVIYLLARTACPKCKESLYGTLDDIGLSNPQMSHCPYCRADFGESAEGS